MKIRIFVHPGSDTFWTQVTRSGIAAEIARKRYEAVYVDRRPITEIDLDTLFAGEKKRVLIYLGNSELLLPQDLRYLAGQGVHVILVNRDTHLLPDNCSKVLLDYHGGIRKSIGYLAASGRDRIALFGVNPSSSTDLLKKNCFEEHLSQKGGDSARDIYYNYANIDACIECFLKNRGLYNAVICANDIVALELIRVLDERGVRVPEDLYVVSCGGSSLVTEAAKIPVTSVYADPHEMGRQAVLAYSALMKNYCDVALTFHVKAKLTIRASTAFAPAPAESYGDMQKRTADDVHFYTDPAVQRLLRIETLLMNFDDLDRDILGGLFAGESYPAIAERIFVTENVVAYRIKKMCRITECESRAELLALLSPYLKS